MNERQIKWRSRSIFGRRVDVVALFCRLCCLLLWAVCLPSQAIEEFQLDRQTLRAGYPVALDAQWGFHFGDHLSLAEVRQKLASNSFERIAVPSPWNEQVAARQNDGYQHGKATYVLPIRLDQPMQTALSIKVLKITDGYQLYWAEQGASHMHAFGQSGDWQRGDAFGIDNSRFHFPIQSSGLLVIYVAKNQTYKGGLRRSLLVQRTDILLKNMDRELIWRSVLLGGFLIMGMHYLVQHFYVRKLLSPLMLSLVSFSAFLRVFTGGGHAYLMLEGLPVSFLLWAEKIEYFSIIFPPTMYMLFFNEMTQRIIPKQVVITILTSLAIIMFVTIMIPQDLMTKSVNLYQFYLLILSCVVFFYMILAVVRKLPNAAALLGSTSVVVAAIINDVYVSHSIHYNLYLLEFGFFIFLYLQANIVGRQLREGLAAAVRLSEEKERLQQSHKQALIASYQDHLTGLSNRKALEDEIDNAFGLEAKDLSLGIILFDLDYFKAINDNYGHDIGDEVLIFVASILHGHTLRASDFKCRYGGEEFLIVLPSANIETAREVAESIRTRIANSIAYSDQHLKLTVTASFGVSAYKAGVHKSVKDVITEADRALYAAKDQGRNCVVASAV